MSQQLQRGIAKLKEHERQQRRQSAFDGAPQGELLGFGSSELSPMSRLPTVSLKKPGQAISISNNLTAQQRKLWNALLLNAYEELPNRDIKFHRMPLSDLQLMIGSNSNNTRQLKDATRALMTTTLEWNIVEERGMDEWEATTALASVQFRDGLCLYEFSQLMRDRLYYPERFANINLMEMRDLTLASAVALYENTARYRTWGATPWFSVEQWKSLLGARGTSYNEFRRLREKVLDPALKQVAELTSIAPKLEVMTHQRKVVRMRFAMDAEEGQAVEDAPNDSTANDEPVTEAVLEALSPLERRLVSEMLLTPEQARTCLAQYGEEHVIAVVNYVAKRFTEGKVEEDRIAPYFLAVVRNFQTPRKSALVGQRNEQEAGRAKAVSEKAQTQAVTSRRETFNSVVRRVSQQFFATLPPEHQAELKATFTEHLRRERNVMLKAWLNDPQSATCQALFRNFLVDHHLPQSRSELQEQYLASTVSDEAFIEAVLADVQRATDRRMIA